MQSVQARLCLLCIYISLSIEMQIGSYSKLPEVILYRVTTRYLGNAMHAGHDVVSVGDAALLMEMSLCALHVCVRDLS